VANTVFALVDYDNLRRGRFRGGAGSGRGPSFQLHEEFLQKLTSRLVEHTAEQFSEFYELRIRLYGGWIDDAGVSTEMRDMLQKAIRNQGKSFRERNCRVFLEIADAPLASPASTLASTFRLIPWRAPIKRSARPLTKCLNSPNPCLNVDNAISWSKGKCPQPTCSVSSSEAFDVEVQKLVDSLIISDLFVAGTNRADLVVVVSRDEDMVPGLISSQAIGTPVHWLRFGTSDASIYDALLRSAGVDLYNFPVLT
jgi:hypothetical protein